MRLSIRLKFILAVLLCLASIMAMGLYRLDRLQQHSFEDEVRNRTELVSEFGKASQAYVNEDLRPATEAKTDDFLIEAMSAPYVTRSLFEKFNRMIPEYSYRQPTLNPLNPINQADAFEADIIQQFQNNLNLEELSGYRQQKNADRFYIAKPVAVTAKCLQCHGRPSQAPPEIIARYGQAQGYNWKVGEIVSALMIYVPTADLKTRQNVVHQAIFTTFVFLGLGLAGTVFLLFEQLINRRIVNLSQAFKQRAHTPNAQIKLNDATQDEVGMLTREFNRMTDKLDQAYHTLENQVAERTQSLTQTLQTLKKTQAQLVHAEKMSSLGKMIGGIAHEINNPAGFIYSNLPHTRDYAQTLIYLVEKLSGQIPDERLPAALRAEIEEADLPFITTDFHRLINSMESGSQRIREIVLSLRSFARLDESELKTVDLHEGLDSTVMLLQKRLEQHHITLSKSYSQLPPITCFPGQLNQVLFHVLSNAIDAVEATPPLTRCSPHIQIRTEQVDAAHCRIRIIDKGVGIAQSILPYIFDPFFTTKQVGDGKGLGLAISHQIIVETHGGELMCTSTLGEGTSIAMVIPIVPEMNTEGVSVA